jgi:phage tail sheath protein FI
VTEFTDDTLLELHRALIRLCAARSDLVAVLSLPAHWREEESLAYTAALKGGTRVTNEILPLGAGESRAFSYAALYHPWILERAPDSVATRRPPDGTVVGAIARRALTRGAWIAPANDPFTGVLGLVPALTPARHLELLLAQVNLLRSEPHGVVTLSADTLSDDPELRPLNIRRLLILLRRAALRLGQTYVFEPNDATLQRIVRGAFESLLQRLFMRGAFAGATAEASYRVVLEEPLNNPRTNDRGAFFVELRVAPANPLSFLTLRLVQLGERATAIELI